jgi:hypothetical protein
MNRFRDDCYKEQEILNQKLEAELFAKEADYDTLLKKLSVSEELVETAKTNIWMEERIKWEALIQSFNKDLKKVKGVEWRQMVDDSC